MPQISVVIPTHNRLDMLRTSIMSALAQRDVDLELIVVDDGSRDGTAKWLAESTDPRMQVVRQDRPGGVSAARNLGLSRATSDWIAFLDDDDVWSPEKLALQLKRAAATGAGWIYTGEVLVGPTLEVLGHPAIAPRPEAVMRHLMHRNPIPGGASGVIVARDYLDRAGPFDTALSALADWELWIRLARLGAPERVPEALVGYRIHASNMSLNWHGFEAEDQIIAERHGVVVDQVRQYRHAAWSLLRVGARGKALRLYMRAIAKGDVRSIGRAAVALVPGLKPELLLRISHRGAERDDRDRVQEWLGALASRTAA